MLKTIQNIINKNELLEIERQIKEKENKKRNYLDNNSKGDSVQRRVAILQIYNDEIQKLSVQYVEILKENLVNTDLDNKDIELFISVMRDTSKTMSAFITKNIKQYGLEKIIMDKVPNDIIIAELERLIDEYLPIYTMQNVHNIPTGYLKGKSRNIYSKISYIVRYYGLDVTIGQLLHSVTKLNISNKEKVIEVLEVDKIVYKQMSQYIQIKRQEFQNVIKGKNEAERSAIANKMENEATKYRKNLYKKEYTQRNIAILEDKRVINSLKRAVNQDFKL